MNLVGYLAGLLTLVGYLPQTIKTIRTRQTEDLSLPTFLIIGASAVLWTIYGYSNHKPAIWVTNGVVSACSVIITRIKLHEG
ncbi:MAG TPA: SemiSWEET family transporter [Candidatus Saccharimonadales bacterium]|jgi:MtN3 and saliva related transmembrane protein|nr:SemiSWEET family transporter [Candidatus Saccharimonadales bacterium]